MTKRRASSFPPVLCTLCPYIRDGTQVFSKIYSCCPYPSQGLSWVCGEKKIPFSQTEVDSNINGFKYKCTKEREQGEKRSFSFSDWPFSSSKLTRLGQCRESRLKDNCPSFRLWEGLTLTISIYSFSNLHIVSLAPRWTTKFPSLWSPKFPHGTVYYVRMKSFPGEYPAQVHLQWDAQCRIYVLPSNLLAY